MHLQKLGTMIARITCQIANAFYCRSSNQSHSSVWMLISLDYATCVELSGRMTNSISQHINYYILLSHAELS